MLGLIKNKFAHFFLVSVLLAASVTARAIPVQFDFTAQYFSTSSVLTGLGLSSNTSIKGSFTFDNNTVDLYSGDPTAGFYSGALSFLSFDIIDNSNSVVTNGSASNGNISVSDNSTTPPAIGQDAFTVYAPGFIGQIGTFNKNYFNLILTDTTGTALSNDLLSSTLPDISAFDIPTIILLYTDGTTSERAEYRITSMVSATTVPEPFTLYLFASGLAGLLLCQRRNRVVSPDLL